jgi:hypothetical protein
MSTSEQWSNKASPCPCGKGQVTQHVDSPDNPWSRAHVSYSLDCPACPALWSLDGTTLVNKASEAGYKAASAELQPVVKELIKKAAALVDDYIKSVQPKTKQAELNALKSAGVSDLDYRSYLKRRKTSSPGQSSYGLKNPAWLLQQAALVGKKDELAALLAQRAMLSTKVDAAAAQIVRKSVKE